MATIFISYRKTGVDKASSLHLAEDLRESFGSDTVFRDEKGLRLGRFDAQLLNQVKSCKAMLAVIGPSWIDRMDELRNPQDWVRKELEEGLRLQILMVPVLVDDARLPRNWELPDSLQDLLTYHSWRIHQRHWKENVSELIDLLAQYLHLEKRTRGEAAIPNLSGNWIDTDGVPITIDHRGNSMRLFLLDQYGQAVGQGEGTISGSQLQFSLFRPDLGQGRGTGTASADGRQISGSVQYGAQRYGFSISRR